MKGLLSISILTFFSVLGFGQPEGCTKEVVLENKIMEIVGVMNMLDTVHVLHGTVIKTFEFDTLGNCFRKKFVHPLRDVVTTSTEYLLTYDDQSRVIEEVKISRREVLTKKDKNFVGIFGEDLDTTITSFIFTSNQLTRKERFNPSKEDTIITLFTYQDSLLVEKEQYSTNLRGELHRKNYKIHYFYDKLQRKVREEKQHPPSALYSVNERSYVADTDLLQSEKSFNGFTWNIKRDGYGNWEHELVQDSLNGRVIEYFYDEDQELEKEMIYSNLADLSQAITIDYDQPTADTKINKTSGNTDDVILFQDEEEKRYNPGGMLLQEKVFLRGKLKYICEYQVKQYE